MTITHHCVSCAVKPLEDKEEFDEWIIKSVIFIQYPILGVGNFLASTETFIVCCVIL